jgi:starch synthase (maltosyl-transferring)
MTTHRPSERRRASATPRERHGAVPARPPAIVFEHVYPTLDGGRHAIKRTLGDTCHVSADIFREGHDLLAARACFRGPGDRSWRYAPMTYDEYGDRWHTQFPLDEIGRWRFTVEAWTDVFQSWRVALEKKREADQDVSLELLEGAEIILDAAQRAPDPVRAKLRARGLELSNQTKPVSERVAQAVDPELTTLMAYLVDTDSLTRHKHAFDIIVDPVQARFVGWYEMFPRSQGTQPGTHATFRDAERRLPRLAQLGFDVIYLPPIHPVGRAFRKGKNNTPTAGPGDPGSPWAIGNENGGHTAVEPDLGTLEDFRHFVTSAAALGMAVALDYALQCSPDHPWLREHPEWFVTRPDGSIKYAENPPKKYQDIYPLDFWCADREGLWSACREIVEFWIEQGVMTFRVDNPHTKPFAFWEWLITTIKDSHPETVFLSEAFTSPKRMWSLAKLGFSQSYTHFTWKNTAPELREYFTLLHQTELPEYFRGNLFTNTPDILHAYLQQGGRPAFRVRLLLAATLSPLYGIYSGYELCENVPVRQGSEEYLNSEKYEIRVRDWEAPGNINEDIAIINRIRRANAALQQQGNLVFHETDNEHFLCYSRTAWQNDLLVVVNVDPKESQEGTVHVPVNDLSLGTDTPYEVEDLLTGERYTWKGSTNYVSLRPEERVGHIFRFV